MNRLEELLERKFLKDVELLELEDYEDVMEIKLIKPYNAHYNEYYVYINCNNTVIKYIVYLKHR